MMNDYTDKCDAGGVHAGIFPVVLTWNIHCLLHFMDDSNILVVVGASLLLTGEMFRQKRWTMSVHTWNNNWHE